MKESILPLFLILLLTIEIDGSRSILKRKQVVDRCHRMQQVRRCSGAPKSWHFDVRVSECKPSSEEECGSIGNRFQTKEDCDKICIDKCRQMQESRLCSGAIRSWHYDVRVSECRISNDEECGALGNRFRSKEDCENMCPGSLNISARQYPLGSRWSDPCCPNYPCNGHNCGHNVPIHPPVIPPAIRYPCPGNHCPQCIGHPCPRPHPCPEPICRHECDPPCPTTTTRPEPICRDKCDPIISTPSPPTTLCPEHPCRHDCNPCHHQYPCHPHPIQSPCPHERNSRCCRTGAYHGRPCQSHHRCGYNCCHVTRRPDCISTSVAPTSTTTRAEPIIELTTTDDSSYDEPTLTPRPYLAKVLHRGVQPREFGRDCSNIRDTCKLQCPKGFARDRYGCHICQCYQNGQAES